MKIIVLRDKRGRFVRRQKPTKTGGRVVVRPTVCPECIMMVRPVSIMHTGGFEKLIIGVFQLIGLFFEGVYHIGGFLIDLTKTGIQAIVQYVDEQQQSKPALLPPPIPNAVNKPPPIPPRPYKQAGGIFDQTNDEQNQPLSDPAKSAEVIVSWYRSLRDSPKPMVVQNNWSSDMEFQCFYVRKGSGGRWIEPAMTVGFIALPRFLDRSRNWTAADFVQFAFADQRLDAGVIPLGWNGGIHLPAGQSMVIAEPPYRLAYTRYVVGARALPSNTYPDLTSLTGNLSDWTADRYSVQEVTFSPFGANPGVKLAGGRLNPYLVISLS